jgi:hypothetical protein
MLSTRIEYRRAAGLPSISIQAAWARGAVNMTSPKGGELRGIAVAAESRTPERPGRSLLLSSSSATLQGIS